MDSFRLVLPYPVSTNRYWRSVVPKGWSRAVTFVSDEAKAYKQAVGWTAKKAGLRAPIAGYVELAIVLHPQRPAKMKNPDEVRCMDLDNCLKVLLDALQGIAYDNDAQVRKLSAERGAPMPHAALVVIISEIPGVQQKTLFPGPSAASGLQPGTSPPQ